jgi:effector-binding domain-containing protein
MVEIKEQESQPTLVIRTRTSVEDLPKALGEAYGAIARYLGELCECPVGAPFSAYFNDDMTNLDVAIGFPVAGPLPGRGNIEASEIPAGKLATCLYTGPYSGLAPAYDALTHWVAENGYEATGVVYEMYLDDPGDTPTEKLRTLIAFPLK